MILINNYLVTLKLLKDPHNTTTGCDTSPHALDQPSKI